LQLHRLEKAFRGCGEVALLVMERSGVDHSFEAACVKTCIFKGKMSYGGERRFEPPIPVLASTTFSKPDSTAWCSESTTYLRVRGPCWGQDTCVRQQLCATIVQPRVSLRLAKKCDSGDCSCSAEPFVKCCQR
jgi:hypothetical protein